MSGAIRYSEPLRVGARGWGLFVLALAITALAVGPVLVPVTALAWVVNLLRYRGAEVRVDDTHVHVGARSAPLLAFDPSTLGRASNTWPWRVRDRNWLGANPVWTRDSVGLIGNDAGKRVWLSVGTNRRDELVAALLDGIGRARQGFEVGHAGARSAKPLPGAGWFADPWDPVRALRWWDGEHWTTSVHPRTLTKDPAQ
jgi:hypothetical protein